MPQAPRMILTAVVFLAIWNFSYWVPFSVIFSRQGMAGVVIANIFSLVTGIAAAFYIWRKTESARDGLGASVLKNAIVVGAIGFSLGFFGPMIFSGGNQGPMLGIFITGPLGLLVGGVIGFVRWVRKTRNAAE